MNKEQRRLDFIERHAPHALLHYLHANEKHPYFCDRLIPGKDYADDVGAEIANNLKAIRERIRRAIRTRRLEWDELLNCEVWEVHEAVYHGDKPHAVEECYDCIAILLRVIDVLEGRQALGKPGAKEGADA